MKNKYDQFTQINVCNKRIPKQKFYDNLNVYTNIKKIFKEQISAIYWRNKASAETVNITKGEAINSVIKVKEESDIESLFKPRGTSALGSIFKELDDFELICFLVVK